jgi:hypothetical protein
MEQDPGQPENLAEGEAAPHIPPVLQAPEIPQLELNMQSMTIVNQQEEIQVFQGNQQYSLFRKLAATRSTPRAISLENLKRQMQRAWRANYGDIIQVHKFVFKAIFPSFGAMMWVFKKQPWMMGPDVILMEFADPAGEGYQKEQEKDVQQGMSPKYMFKFVYITVRVYGIPWNRRSLDLLADILRKVGTPSEFHELKENMLFTHPDYIWGVIRHTICNPVVDRIKLALGQDQESFAYLHYEKVGRICLFCGVMFHVIGNCHLRDSIITNKIMKGQQVHDVPFQIFSHWTIDESKIPLKKEEQTGTSNPVFTEFQNRELADFHRMFNKSEARAGTSRDSVIANAMLRMDWQRPPIDESAAGTATAPIPVNTVQPPLVTGAETPLRRQRDAQTLQGTTMQPTHVPTMTVQPPPRVTEMSTGQSGAKDKHLQNPSSEQPVRNKETVQEMEVDVSRLAAQKDTVDARTGLPYSMEEEAAILQGASQQNKETGQQKPSPQERSPRRNSSEGGDGSLRLLPSSLPTPEEEHHRQSAEQNSNRSPHRSTFQQQAKFQRNEFESQADQRIKGKSHAALTDDKQATTRISQFPPKVTPSKRSATPIPSQPLQKLPRSESSGGQSRRHGGPPVPQLRAGQGGSGQAGAGGRSQEQIRPGAAARSDAGARERVSFPAEVQSRSPASSSSRRPSPRHFKPGHPSDGQRPPLQRLGLLVEGLDGINSHKFKLERSSDLLWGIISIALVLPLGSVLQAPGAWALASLCALLAALLWEELSAPPLRRLAAALRISLQTLPISTLGRTRLQRLRRWARSLPGEALSLLLESLASSTWPAIVTICFMAPVNSDMISPKINLQQLI